MCFGEFWRQLTSILVPLSGSPQSCCYNGLNLMYLWNAISMFKTVRSKSASSPASKTNKDQIAEENPDLARTSGTSKPAMPGMSASEM